MDFNGQHSTNLAAEFCKGGGEDRLFCAKCGRSKHLADFYSKGEGRRDNWCKKCRLKQKKDGRKKKARELKTVDEFTVFFDGEPDERLFVERLRPLIEELK